MDPLVELLAALPTDVPLGIEAPNLTGGISTMLPNHHITKPVLIGEIKADGQFSVVWKTPGPVKAKPWSPFIPGNDKKKDEPDGKTKIGRASCRVRV